jgi:hypothetical protein
VGDRFFIFAIKDDHKKLSHRLPVSPVPPVGGQGTCGARSLGAARLSGK